MADEGKPGQPTLREIATAGLTIARRLMAFGELLEPSDKILRARGGDLEIYRDVLRDDQVASTFQQRRMAVVSREWAVEPGGTSRRDKKAAQAIEDNLKSIEFDRICNGMLYGIFYGYAVGECMWKIEDGLVRLDKVKVRDRARFRWDKDERLRLLTLEQPQGIVMPERKFWTFSAGADHDDEPYGLGLAHWLWWPVFFKRNDLKFWLIFLEKFGQPTVTGKYPQGASPDEQEKLLEAAAAVATEAAVTVPEGFALELLEAARAGTTTHEKLYHQMNGAIAKIVLSQTMTTDDGSSLAQAQVHDDVKDEVVKADSDLQMSSFNEGPVRWLTMWNFPGAMPPKVWRRVEDEPDLKPIAERDEIILRLGYRPTPEYIETTYGEGYERVEEKAPVAAPGAPGADQRAVDQEDEDTEDLAESVCPDCGGSFAEPPNGDGPDDVPDELADELEEATAAVSGSLVEEVRALLDQAESFEDLAERLAQRRQDMPPAELSTLLRNALVVAEMTGRSEIVEASSARPASGKASA